MYICADVMHRDATGIRTDACFAVISDNAKDTGKIMIQQSTDSVSKSTVDIFIYIVKGKRSSVTN